MNLENLINIDDKLTDAYIMLDNANTLNETIFNEFEHLREHATEPYEIMMLEQTKKAKKLNDIEHDYLLSLNKILDEISNALNQGIEQQRKIEFNEE